LPLFAAGERDLAEVPLLRFGFLAAFRVGFLALAAAALGVFRFVVLVDGFFAADAFFVVLVLGGVEAVFDFSFVSLLRFLAAPIAAPESAPITVPTTGSPIAVPATAPATAPPRVLPVVPVTLSAASSFFLSSSMFLSQS
jgi:hypothetical protein